MTALAIGGRRTLRFVFAAWPLILIVLTLCFIGYGVNNVVHRWYRGIYAGFHYGDAKWVAINSLIVKYGRDDASQFRFATPPVINTHSHNLFIDGQIRVFHLIGPRGVRYCISVWSPGDYWTGDNATGINIGGDTKIVKGCKF